jgi:pyruvate ferredoxin oxidoreductase beta subunit
VFEAEHGEVKSVSKIRRQLPVEDYLRPQTRFAHLFKPPGHADLIARIQALADKNVRRFDLLDTTEAA